MRLHHDVGHAIERAVDAQRCDTLNRRPEVQRLVVTDMLTAAPMNIYVGPRDRRRDRRIR
jgi:hypothetical protein